MTENKNTSEPQTSKPSWFALVDSDAPSAQVTKVNKKLPVIALFVTGAIAASGTFFANVSNQSANATSSISTNSISTGNADTAPAPAAETVVAHTASVSKKVAASNTAVQNPSQGGVQAPRGGGHDDDNGDDENEREVRD